jgi:hypothetical protein
MRLPSKERDVKVLKKGALRSNRPTGSGIIPTLVFLVPLFS